MSVSLPPLSWFRAFEASARHLSFTKAAMELGVTQSAVSQNIRALEDKLGHRLFIRKARGISLSDYGRNLLPEISQGLNTIIQAVDNMGVDQDNIPVTIATSHSFARWYIAPNAEAFHASNSDIKLRIITSLWPSDFVNSRADIEIRFGSAEQVGVNADRLLPDELILVAASGAVLTSHQNHWDKLSLYPFVEVQGTSNKLQDWCQQGGFLCDIKPFAYVDHYGIAIDMLMSGGAVSLVSSLIAKPAIQSQALEIVHSHKIVSPDGYFMAIKTSDRSEPIERVTQWLRYLVKG